MVICASDTIICEPNIIDDVPSMIVCGPEMVACSMKMIVDVAPIIVSAVEKTESLTDLIVEGMETTVSQSSTITDDVEINVKDTELIVTMVFVERTRNFDLSSLHRKTSPDTCALPRRYRSFAANCVCEPKRWTPWNDRKSSVWSCKKSWLAVIRFESDIPFR